MQWLGGMFVKWILDWVLEQIKELIATWRADKARHEEAKQDAAEQLAKLKKVEGKEDASAEEISAAIDDASKRF